MAREPEALAVGRREDLADAVVLEPAISAGDDHPAAAAVDADVAAARLPGADRRGSVKYSMWPPW